jgi:hypothetical protein
MANSVYVQGTAPHNLPANLLFREESAQILHRTILSCTDLACFHPNIGSPQALAVPTRCFSTASQSATVCHSSPDPKLSTNLFLEAQQHCSEFDIPLREHQFSITDGACRGKKTFPGHRGPDQTCFTSSQAVSS